MNTYRFKYVINSLSILVLVLVGCTLNSPNHSSESFESNQDSDQKTSETITTNSKVQKTVSSYKLTQNEIILNEATKISNDFYNNLIQQNYIGANKYMSKAALSVTSEAQWIEIYKKAQNKKGRLGYVKMWDHGVKCNMKGGNGVGDYAELIFDAQYKDGNFREKLTFFRKDSTQKVEILGYEYDERIERVTIYEELE